MPSIVVRPKARADLYDHFLYTGERQYDAATRFLRQARRAFVDLAEMPMSGRAMETDDPALNGIRIGHIAGYRRYLIFYRPLDDGVDILRVLHGGRDLPSILSETAR